MHKNTAKPLMNSSVARLPYQSKTFRDSFRKHIGKLSLARILCVALNKLAYGHSTPTALILCGNITNNSKMQPHHLPILPNHNLYHRSPPLLNNIVPAYSTRLNTSNIPHLIRPPVQ